MGIKKMPTTFVKQVTLSVEKGQYIDVYIDNPGTADESVAIGVGGDLVYVPSAAWEAVKEQVDGMLDQPWPEPSGAKKD